MLINNASIETKEKFLFFTPLLPREIWGVVFSYLPFNEWSKIAKVCKNWNTIQKEAAFRLKEKHTLKSYKDFISTGVNNRFGKGDPSIGDERVNFRIKETVYEKFRTEHNAVLLGADSKQVLIFEKELDNLITIDRSLWALNIALAQDYKNSSGTSTKNIGERQKAKQVLNQKREEVLAQLILFYLDQPKIMAYLASGKYSCLVLDENQIETTVIKLLNTQFPHYKYWLRERIVKLSEIKQEPANKRQRIDNNGSFSIEVRAVLQELIYTNNLKNREYDKETP